MKYGFGELDTYIGDIWELATEAFINPVHDNLRPTPGIAQQLLRRAGPEVSNLLSQRGNIGVGHAFISDAGDLRAKFLVHISIGTLAHKPSIGTVDDALEEAFLLCQRQSLKSVAVPPIAMDPGELPVGVCANILVKHALTSLNRSSLPERVVLVAPSKYVENIYQQAIDKFILD